eukprot:141849_1
MSLSLLRKQPTRNCRKKITSCSCYKRWRKYALINNKTQQCFEQFQKQSHKYNISELYDDYMHIIIFHPDRKSIETQANCHLFTCRAILHNYGKANNLRRYVGENTEEDNYQQLFMEIIFVQHEQIYHIKSPKDMLAIRQRYPRYDKLMTRYMHNNAEINDKIDDEIDRYECGELFNYTKKSSKRYIWNKHNGLKSEWFSFKKFQISKWKNKTLRAEYLANSKFVKKNFKCEDKTMSPVRILVIYEYTANDDLQQELCRIARLRLKDCKSFKELKREHGRWGHTYKLLRETVEKFGINMSDDAIVYRGIDKIRTFKSTTVHCYVPTSTSISRGIASTFAMYGQGSGCILELHKHWRLCSKYLSVGLMSKYQHEKEWLCYGKYSHLYIMNIKHCVREINICEFKSIVLMEDLISDNDGYLNGSSVTGEKMIKSKVKKRGKRKKVLMKQFEVYSDDCIHELSNLLKQYMQCKLSDKVNDEGCIQMRQLDYIILSKDEKIYFRNDMLIKCINKVFGFDDNKVRIDNIVNIFSNITEIVFKYKIEQCSIEKYCSQENKKCKLFKITVYNENIQDEYRILESQSNIKISNLLVLTEWVMFQESNKIVWRRPIQITD